MASKIFTGGKPFPKACTNPPAITEIRMLLKPNNKFYIEASGQTELILDFDAEKSIKVTQQGKKDSYKIEPVIKVVGVSYQ